MSLSEKLAPLSDGSPVVLPSLLLCDFGNLEREVERLEAAGVRALHLDVMDGRFVPNLTYGMPIVAAFRRLSSLPLDVHLMIEKPEEYIQQFVEAGADLITIHVEACADAVGALKQIQSAGVAAGIAVNPETPLADIEPCLEHADLALVMSVRPGFGGQKFNPVAIEKLQRLQEITQGDVILEVDGGINEETIADCAAAGARWFVVGSGIFKRDDYNAAVQELTSLAAC